MNECEKCKVELENEEIIETDNNKSICSPCYIKYYDPYSTYNESE